MGLSLTGIDFTDLICVMGLRCGCGGLVCYFLILFFYGFIKRFALDSFGSCLRYYVGRFPL